MSHDTVVLGQIFPLSIFTVNSSEDYNKQIDAEHILKTLIDQKLISISQRKVATLEALPIAQKLTNSCIDDVEVRYF
jgi:hypothetical protein